MYQKNTNRFYCLRSFILIGKYKNVIIKTKILQKLKRKALVKTLKKDNNDEFLILIDKDVLQLNISTVKKAEDYLLEEYLSNKGKSSLDIVYRYEQLKTDKGILKLLMAELNDTNNLAPINNLLSVTFMLMYFIKKSTYNLKNTNF